MSPGATSRHPGGMTACSRWLSEATPPDMAPQTTSHPGGVPAWTGTGGWGRGHAGGLGRRCVLGDAAVDVRAPGDGWDRHPGRRVAWPWATAFRPVGPVWGSLCVVASWREKTKWEGSSYKDAKARRLRDQDLERGMRRGPGRNGRRVTGCEGDPKTARSVPVTARSVPASARSVPASARSVAATARSVPVTARSVPAIARSVPVTARSVPVTARRVAASARSVPVTARSVAATI